MRHWHIFIETDYGTIRDIQHIAIVRLKGNWWTTDGINIPGVECYFLIGGYLHTGTIYTFLYDGFRWSEGACYTTLIDKLTVPDKNQIDRSISEYLNAGYVQ